MFTVTQVDRADVLDAFPAIDAETVTRIVAAVNAARPFDEAEAAQLIAFRVELEVILAARPGDVIDGLTVALRSWSPEAGARADALGPDAAYAAYVAAMGTPDTVTLTADGRGVETGSWCRCGGDTGVVWVESDGIGADDAWVRYARYSPAGREGHGYVHRVCRRLLQVG